MTASLFVIFGRDQGTRFELDAESASFPLGRDAGNRIQLHDTEVSRRHAELRRHGDMLLSSPIWAAPTARSSTTSEIQQRELASGDQVQIGRTVMLFTGPGGSASSNLGSQIDIVGGRRLRRSFADLAFDQPARGKPHLFAAASSGTPKSQWLARARSNLQVMYRTALAVSHTLDIDQLAAADHAIDFRMGRGRPRLHHAARSGDEATRAQGAAATAKGTRADDKITISQTILDYVMQRREGVLTSDARQDDRWDSAASIVRSGVREAICVPMQGRYDVVGLIYIDTSIPRRPGVGATARNKFTEEHLKLMVAIGHQAALAVEDTNYYSAMVQAERLAAVGQTIATLSHHIKNILQGIRGGSYLIEMGLAEHDEQVRPQGLAHRRAESEQNLGAGDGHAHVQQGARARFRRRPI